MIFIHLGILMSREPVQQQTIVLECIGYTTVTQRQRDNYPMQVQCWSTVNNAGTTLNQHWFIAMCLKNVFLYSERSQSCNTQSPNVCLGSGRLNSAPHMVTLHHIQVGLSSWKGGIWLTYKPSDS